jgi:hypothetical protein
MVSKLGLLAALLLAVGIGNEARADQKVDWSEYVEPAGSRTPARSAAAAKATPPTKPVAPQRKTSRRQVAKSSSTESRAKTEQQRPARSRHRH